ncbi:MAG: DUF5331 domain-containing protein [Cyanobacteria bacterium J06621_12]
MANILAQPEQFTAELINKWLDYPQANRSWLQHCMDEVGLDFAPELELKKRSQQTNNQGLEIDSRYRESS